MRELRMEVAKVRFGGGGEEVGERHDVNSYRLTCTVEVSTA